jgi:hypothetical protein
MRDAARKSVAGLNPHNVTAAFAAVLSALAHPAAAAGSTPASATGSAS